MLTSAGESDQKGWWPATRDKWRTFRIANALTTGCYVCSVNRPAPENGFLIGGASIMVGPNGEVLAESFAAITVCTARQSTIKQARIEYPGYLACRSDLYAKELQNVRNK